MATPISDKINHLFATRHSPRRRPYTNAEVAASTGLAASLIGYLRTGRRENPTMHTLLALSRHFGVSGAYFFDDDPAGRTDAALGQAVLDQALGGALQRPDVLDLAARVAGLSAESVAMMTCMADRLRLLERPSGRPTRIAS